MTSQLIADILSSLEHSTRLPERLRRQTEDALRLRRALELEAQAIAIHHAAQEIDRHAS